MQCPICKKDLEIKNKKIGENEAGEAIYNEFAICRDCKKQWNLDKQREKKKKLAKEAQLTEKYAALYNGEMINTGEKRLVLHQLTRGQLGDTVTADGVDKRAFYKQQQERIAEFANKVHNGEITNAATP